MEWKTQSAGDADSHVISIAGGMPQRESLQARPTFGNVLLKTPY